MLRLLSLVINPLRMTPTRTGVTKQRNTCKVYGPWDPDWVLRLWNLHLGLEISHRKVVTEDMVSLKKNLDLENATLLANRSHNIVLPSPLSLKNCIIGHFKGFVCFAKIRTLSLVPVLHRELWQKNEWMQIGTDSLARFKLIQDD